MNTRALNFPLMDSMRGIAVIAVVLTHVSFFTALKGEDTTQVRFGFISVTIFFMLSAFLLYGPWVAARFDERDAIRVRAFAWRRVLRVVPAYYVALTVIALALGLSYVFTADGIPTLYGFAQAYRPDWVIRGLPQAWTLGVEAVFYVMLPLWAGLMRRLPAGPQSRQLRQELAGCAVLFALSLAYKVVITATGAIEDEYGRTLQLNFLTFLDDFAIGMALATVAAAYAGRRDQPRALRLIDERPWLPWVGMFAALGAGASYLGLLGQVGDITDTGVSYVVRHYIIEVIAVCLLLPAMFGDFRRGFVRRVLRNRALLYVGMISYGVYLWHLGVLTQLDRWGFEEVAAKHTLVWSAAVLPISIVIASLSYYLIERPFLSLKGRVRARPEPRPGESLAEPAPATPTRP